MNTAFEKKLLSIQEEAPDDLDLAMIAEAERENDGSTVDLQEYMNELSQYSGKLSLRVPRSLHKELAEAAKMEGVSLNQYALYKLAH